MQVLLIIALLISSTAFAQNHWEIINRSDTRCGTIQFVTPQIGWAGSINQPYGLYKTTDGGYSWNGVVPFQEIATTQIVFYNERRGFMGDGPRGAVTYDGETWTVFQQPSGIDVDNAVYLDSVNMIGISNIMFSEDSVLRQFSSSSDGGRTWERVYWDRDNWILGPVPVVSRTGTILVAGRRNELWRSTDRGSSWQPINIWPFYSGILAAADSTLFFQGTRRVGVHRAEITKSQDDGLTWSTVWTDTSQGGQYFGPLDIKFTDQFHGWASWDAGLMLETADGGESWQSYSMSESVFGVTSLSFLDSAQGWAIDPGVQSPTLVYRYSTSSDVNEPWNAAVLSGALQINRVYPNPFNSETTISLHVPGISHVSAEVYDIMGRSVDVICNNLLVSGAYQFNWKGLSHVSGIYFLRITDGKQSVTAKLHLLK